MYQAEQSNIIHSDKLEALMIENSLTAFDFSTDDRRLQPMLYMFSIKHNRNNHELLRNIRISIINDIKRSKFNQELLTDMLTSITHELTGG